MSDDQRSSLSPELSWESFGDLISSPRSTDHLMREAKALAIAPSVKAINLNKSVRLDKFLVAMLENAIGDEGKRYAAAVVLSKVHNPLLLREVGQAWLENMIYPMKAAGHVRTTKPSSGQTPTLDDTAILIESARRDQKALKPLLLRRDGYRCVITGELSLEAPDDWRGPRGSIQAAHILPYSLNKFDEKPSKGLHNSTIAWDMIKHWGSLDIQALVGEGINDVSNALSMDSSAHDFFGDFQLWLEPMTEPNKYIVRTRVESRFSDREVTFRDHSGASIPLPDSRYLALHAAFARVLYSSGAGEYFDRVLRDAEYSGVLRADGTSDLGPLLGCLSLLPKVSAY